MNKKIILPAIVFIAVISILLIGTGITGFIILEDENIAPICETDNDCNNDDVCCLFYHESEGACAKKEICADIAVITSQKENIIGTAQTSNKEAIDFALGILLAIGAAALIYGYVKGPSDQELSKDTKI